MCALMPAEYGQIVSPVPGNGHIGGPCLQRAAMLPRLPPPI